MEEFARLLIAQFKVIKLAPFPFVASIALAVLAIWRAFSWRYQGVIEQLKETIVYKDSTIQHLESKLQNREPDNRFAPQEEVKETNSILPTPTLPGSAGELVELTSDKLISTYERLQGLQLDEYLQSIVGTKVQVQGIIQQVSRVGDEYVIYLTLRKARTIIEHLRLFVSLWFTEKPDEIDLMRPDDVITAEGIVETMSSGSGATLNSVEITAWTPHSAAQ